MLKQRKRPSRAQMMGTAFTFSVCVLLGGAAVVVAKPPLELPTNKQSIAVGMVARQATVSAIATQANRPAGAMLVLPTFPLITAPVSTPRTGIFNYKQSAFSREIIGETQWQNQVNGEVVVVITGALTRDPEQGVVIVQHGDSPSDKRFSYSFHQPSVKKGPLTIVAVSSDLRFTLSTKDGALSIFDLSSRTFVGAPAAGDATRAPTLPTTTPRPALAASPTRWIPATPGTPEPRSGTPAATRAPANVP